MSTYFRPGDSNLSPIINPLYEDPSEEAVPAYSNLRKVVPYPSGESDREAISYGKPLDGQLSEHKISLFNHQNGEFKALMPSEQGELSRNTDAAKTYKASEERRIFENRLLAGSAAAGVAAGTGVGVASALQPPHDPSLFDHISPKNVPIDEIKILAAHNTGSIAGRGTVAVNANHSMELDEILEKTPIRGIDLDVHRHNGQMFINHGGIFDPLVSDDDMITLNQALGTMNAWLDKPENHDEVLFLNISSWPQRHFHSELDDVFGQGSTIIFDPDAFLSEFGRMPTIEELRAGGYKVVYFLPHGRDKGGVCTEPNGPFEFPIAYFYEDRTTMEQFKDIDISVGGHSSTDIVPHLTTEDVDNIMGSPGAAWIALDQVSVNDPRFFKPEDRDSLILRPDLKLMGCVYESDEAYQSALLGFGTATAGVTAAFALAGGAYQGILNERNIRHQDKLMPDQLKAMELTAILQKRKKSKKYAGQPLAKKITLEEVKDLYKQNQLNVISKDTIVSGSSATISLTGSALALGMLFPPLMPAFGGAAVGVVGTGIAATLLACFGNRKRLGKAIDEAFESPGVQEALEQRVWAMNQDIKSCIEGDNNIEALLSSMVHEREKGERLLKASTIMLNVSLVARASGMSKYGMPALASAAIGVGGTITGVLVALSAVMNARDRRKKMKQLPQTMVEVMRPKYGRKQKRKLGLFGDSAFQRFLNKNRQEVIEELGLDSGCTQKELTTALMLPDNEQKLEYYLRGFAKKEWLKDLAAFAQDQKPKQDFAEVRKDPGKLRTLLKEYAIKRVGDFAYNDTFSEGRSGTLKLTMIAAFSGIFFFPMFGLAAGALVVGLCASKSVAAYERTLFTKELKNLIENEPTADDQKMIAHNALNALIDNWASMLMLDRLESPAA